MTWLLTVSSAMESCAAISLFAFPLAINRSTSISRDGQIVIRGMVGQFGGYLRRDSLLAGMDRTDGVQEFSVHVSL